MHIIADIGGTKLRIAKSKDLRTFADTVILETPQNYDEGLKLLAVTAKRLAGHEPIETLIAGCPASLTPDRKSLLQATVSDWTGKSLADDLEKMLQTRVHLENDTVLGGLGEAHFGAGIGSRILVYYTVSTGINGVRIVEGNVEPSTFVSDVNGHPCVMTKRV
jgi:glucokinase